MTDLFKKKNKKNNVAQGNNIETSDLGQLSCYTKYLHHIIPNGENAIQCVYKGKFVGKQILRCMTEQIIPQYFGSAH